MNIKVKTRWIAALRSGEYKQGKRTLHELNGCFCALGVLCDLYAQDHKETWIPMHIMIEGEYEEVFALNHPVSAVYCASTPSAAVSKWAGVNCNPLVEAVSISGVLHEYRLSEVNDVLNYSFNQIADLIEAQL